MTALPALFLGLSVGLLFGCALCIFVREVRPHLDAPLLGMAAAQIIGAGVSMLTGMSLL